MTYFTPQRMTIGFEPVFISMLASPAPSTPRLVSCQLMAAVENASRLPLLTMTTAIWATLGAFELSARILCMRHLAIDIKESRVKFPGLLPLFYTTYKISGLLLTTLVSVSWGLYRPDHNHRLHQFLRLLDPLSKAPDAVLTQRIAELTTENRTLTTQLAASKQDVARLTEVPPSLPLLPDSPPVSPRQLDTSGENISSIQEIQVMIDGIRKSTAELEANKASLTAQLAAQQKRAEDLEGEKTALKDASTKEKLDLQAQLDVVQKAAASLAMQGAELTSKLSSATASADKSAKEKADLTAQLDESRKAEAELEVRLEGAQSRAINASAHYQQLQEQHAAQEKALINSQTEIQRLRQQLHAVDVRVAEFEKEKTLLLDSQTRVTQLVGDINELNKQLAIQQIRSEDLESANAHLTEELTKSQTRLNTLQSKLNASESTNTSSNASISEEDASSIGRPHVEESTDKSGKPRNVRKPVASTNSKLHELKAKAAATAAAAKAATEAKSQN